MSTAPTVRIPFITTRTTRRLQDHIRSFEGGEWPKMLEPFRPLLANERYKGAYGGRGGAKSHFFAEYLIRRAYRQPIRAVCIREIQKSLDQSVKRLLEDKIGQMHIHGFDIYSNHIRTPHNGMIIFQGMQDHTAESIKSLEGYDIAWVEEAQTFSKRSLDLLRPTIRKAGSELWFSWNPREPTDPVDMFFRAPNHYPGAISVQTSYRDNPHLPKSMLEEIAWDHAHDADKAAHVWGGGYRKLSEARVYKKWKVEEVEPPPNAAFLFGADWGFSIDPTCLLRCWFHPERPRTLIIDYELFKIGLEVEDTPAFFDGLICGCDLTPTQLRLAEGEQWQLCRRSGDHGRVRKEKITADSSRPETISHVKRHGYRGIEPSIKGPKSVEEGISFLQSYEILVHPRCKHVINELTYYEYKTDPLTGKVLPILQDKKNHLLDSLRYAVERVRRARLRGGVL